MKMPKICAVASAGGHLTQLLSLRSAWEGHEVVYVSTAEMVREKLSALGRTYIVDECNREHPVKTLLVMGECARIVIHERPDVVLSTGAAPGLLVCFWGKMFGARVLWLDSIANTRSLSMSGQLARRFCDLVLTQWSEVAARYPDVEYAGEVI